MFGDAALGALNLKMIEVARSVGAAAKFTGSGGAIVALCPQGEQQEQQLQGEGLILLCSDLAATGLVKCRGCIYLG
jgi:glucuronokinase